METIAIWGTGKAALDFLDLLDMERFRVVAWIDGDSAKWGAPFQGLTVLNPDALPNLAYDWLVIASSFSDEILPLALRLGASEKRIFLSVTNSFGTRIAFGCAAAAPEGLTPEIAAMLDGRKWFHSIEVFPGVSTPGFTRLYPEFIDFPGLVDFSGKQVLDIGAWDGAYTFEVEKRGAASVTAFDIQPPDKSGFNAMRSLRKSRAAHIVESVEKLNPQAHGMFVIVMYFGVYYHLFNPLLSFFNINAVLPIGGLMLFEGAVLDYSYNVDKGWRTRKDNMATYTDVPLAFFAKREFWGDWSTWFVPNLLCLRDWIETAGFEILELKSLESLSRGYGVARKIGGASLEHVVL